MSPARRERRRAAGEANQQGSMVLFVLGLCVAVLMLGALSVDFWRVLAVRRSLAAMADASATAGANGLDQSALRRGVIALDPSQARALATDELAQERDGRLVLNADVTATTDDVVVTLDSEVDVGLLGLLGVHEAIPVRVHAAAAPRRIP